MPGFFSLEGAKQALGVTETLESCLQQQASVQQASELAATRQWWEQEANTGWAKVDHLLYLPVLGLTRPRDLYYYQGQGLAVLSGFTYKYMTVEHFLGRLGRLQAGQPLALALSRCYTQAWYPGDSPLRIYADWHVKPHWTKQTSQSGAVTMWGRIMPGTKQLLINGPAGQPLLGLNRPIDRHLNGELVALEERLTAHWQRPIGLTIFDSEGGGLPLGQRYLAANRPYLSHLARPGYKLAAFETLGHWQPVSADPAREVTLARWRDPAQAEADQRDLVLLRRQGDTDPTRVYAGKLPAGLPLADVPGLYRSRWSRQERVIRELVNGANLNANFGYASCDVPNRTIQRQWAEAQEQVESSERQVAALRQAGRNLWPQQQSLDQTYRQQQPPLRRQLQQQQTDFLARQATGHRLRRSQQRLARTLAQLDQARQRYQRQQDKQQAKLDQIKARLAQATTELTRRRQAREALDTTSLYRERNLEKDQMMLNLHLLLGNLHHWARSAFFAPEWQSLELKTAIELIYRKSGWVQWGRDTIEVVLEPYRYPEQQQAMAETCRRFNAANLRWRDGRRLLIRVAPP
jgi:hypothetical protein